MPKNIAGAFGEQYTAEKLEAAGYAVLERNYHSRWGEIDIIAAKGAYLVFVEVKTRGQDALGTPLEAITRSKQRKLLQTAMQYLQEHPEYAHLQPRFDAAGLVLNNAGAVVEKCYIPNAFSAEGQGGIL